MKLNYNKETKSFSVTKNKTFSPGDLYYIVEVASKNGDIRYETWDYSRVRSEYGESRPFVGMKKQLSDSKLTIKEGNIRSRDEAREIKEKRGYKNQVGGKTFSPKEGSVKVEIDPAKVKEGIKILERYEAKRSYYDPIKVLMKESGCTKEQAEFIIGCF